MLWLVVLVMDWILVCETRGVRRVGEGREGGLLLLLQLMLVMLMLLLELLLMLLLWMHLEGRKGVEMVGRGRGMRDVRVERRRRRRVVVRVALAWVVARRVGG